MHDSLNFGWVCMICMVCNGKGDGFPQYSPMFVFRAKSVLPCQKRLPMHNSLISGDPNDIAKVLHRGIDMPVETFH